MPQMLNALSPVAKLKNWFVSDGRHFQVVSQVIFLSYGISYLGWDAEWLNFTFAFAGTLLIQLLAIRWAGYPSHSVKSALITSLGLSLLLKANHPILFLFAAVLAISQKFLFRYNGKHFWNPANFGIVMVIWLSGEAWISPGQWGSSALLIFIIGTGGLAVLSRIKRLDTGLCFILTFAVLEYARTVVYLGWGHDVWLHKLSSGSLWLFSLFMITDPMTSPDNRYVRRLWAMAVAGIAFYMANFHFINAAPFWVLFFATPAVPLLDRWFAKQRFSWHTDSSSSLTAKPVVPQFKIQHLTHMKNSIILLLGSLLALMVSTSASAFCGFYVAKADAKLFNNKSEVILVRDGIHTVITMSNDFQGPVRDFAMVIPVPVVIKKENIKVVDRRVFDALDAYSAPRLVEYYDYNPCQPQFDLCYKSVPMITMEGMVIAEDASESESFGVTIEASYTVGEYDILVLSATESTGLKNWLLLNGYKIPETANEVLDPYIKSNTKFFVAKVNLDTVVSTGYDYLRPLQISFDHEKFMLPIRLGMANSTGEQDLIVYGFSKTGRIECTNYRTIKTPTDRNIPLHVKDNFGEFYKNLYDKAYMREGRNAVFLEYAWNVSPFNAVKCDPCVGPPPINMDFVDAGIPWLDGASPLNSVFFTRLHVRYSRTKFPSDLQFQVTPNTENFQCRY
ncbi:MAG: DUF2330 domain-containing protein, partial [Flavobacteriales bacterium]|nr:DUF2330 domain-containing protein [Flavobacteriales bacterium]